jgi:uncharacterized repeat protein (TIGR03803 family)
LHTFSGSDGDGPIGDLVLSGNTLYGVTQTGGTNNLGTIFSVYTNGSGFTSLYSFTGLSDGAHPEAGLILTNGTLYGTAYDGADYGTIFSICTNGIGFTPLHTFTGYGDGGNPEAPLVLISNVLYGTASVSHDGYGIIFSLSTNGTNYRTLYSFSNSPDGSTPEGSLAVTGDTIYGTTYEGGSNGYGTIFSFTIGSTNEEIL